MARSADRSRPRIRRGRVLAGIAVLGAAGPLAGCATTQQKAARLQLNSARLRAEQVPTKIRSQSTTVRAAKISLLREGRHTAFLVTVTNYGRRAVSDLALLVGYRNTGGDVFVNGAAGTDYFDAHLPRIAPGASLQWVATTSHAVPSDARPVAEIGAHSVVPVSDLQKPPILAAAARSGADGGVVSVRVHNDSGVPQYQLPLYAIVDAGGRAVAAGSTNITELDGGATRTVHLHLLGSAASGASVHVTATPTIFN